MVCFCQIMLQSSSTKNLQFVILEQKIVGARQNLSKMINMFNRPYKTGLFKLHFHAHFVITTSYTHKTPNHRECHIHHENMSV